uniref:BAR/IMD domain containing adaptor protein 2 like 1b n=1 Tax=Xiphophorus couchianus TaxID=32473 RepID=A0A3B5LKT1_9TELE
MSNKVDEANKLAESTYKNVMEQFNPGLRNLVNLGKSYEKSVHAMSMAGKMYFDALSKIGENAAVSPVSKELGAVLVEISEVHRKAQLEMEENFKRFHREIITELERKTDMDVKYMTATFKRYQMEHKMKQDSLEKSQADLKKLRRKSQGKNANKYESKESEILEALTVRQTEMQLFLADGCKEALLEEKRRFCFLVDKHCLLTYQFASYHDKTRDLLSTKLSSWQDQCNDATNMPDSVLFMIDELRKPVAIDECVGQADISCFFLIVIFLCLLHLSLFSSFSPPDHENGDENNLARSVSVATGLNSMARRPRVRTIFPHTAGNNSTLLSFDEGDIIILLIPDERDGWMYGEMEKNGNHLVIKLSSLLVTFLLLHLFLHSETTAPLRSRSVVNLHHQDTETDEATMVLPPTDYYSKRSKPLSTVSVATNNHQHSPTPSAASSTSSDQNSVSQQAGDLVSGNPFATVRLRPTVTNDRSAPVI